MSRHRESLAPSTFTSWVIGGLLTLVPLAFAAESPNGDDASVPAPLSPAEIDTILSESEPFLRARPTDRILMLSHELEARGLPRAARELRSTVKTSELVKELLRMGQLSAASELIQHWMQEEPRNNEARILNAVALYGEGSYELAERMIPTAMSDASSSERDFLRTLAELSAYQASHPQPASSEGNPWNVRFTVEDGQYTAGRLAAAEKAKIPPGTTRAVAELVSLLPTSASTWALLGELLNADGSIAAARVCLERARALGFTPRSLVEHIRVLTEHEQSQRQQLDASITGGEAAKRPPEESSGQSRNIIVLTIGIVFVAMIIVLQARQWIGRARAPRT